MHISWNIAFADCCGGLKSHIWMLMILAVGDATTKQCKFLLMQNISKCGGKSEQHKLQCINPSLLGEPV